LRETWVLSTEEIEEERPAALFERGLLALFFEDRSAPVCPAGF